MPTKFGIAIPQGVRSDLPDASSQNQLTFMEACAKEAEDLSFDSIWLCDHFHNMQVTLKSCFECWTTLTYLAARTRRIRLGTIVTCNSYRNPSVLAKIASEVDVISNGRLEFGIGAGWFDQEYRAYGFEFEKPIVRIRKLREALQVIKMMWTEDYATFDGTYYHVKDAMNLPKPLQTPHPPITIGGEGERMLRVVAEFADKCNFNAPVGNYRRRLEVLERECREVGRDFGTIEKTMYCEMVVAKTRDEVNDLLTGLSELHVLTGTYLGDGRHELISPEIYGKSNVVGTPTECVEQIRGFVDLGVDYFIFTLPQIRPIDSMKLFAKEVAPSFN